MNCHANIKNIFRDFVKNVFVHMSQWIWGSVIFYACYSIGVTLTTRSRTRFCGLIIIMFVRVLRTQMESSSLQGIWLRLLKRRRLSSSRRCSKRKSTAAIMCFHNFKSENVSFHTSQEYKELASILFSFISLFNVRIKTTFKDFG